MKYLESFFWGILAALGALLIELIILNVIQLSTFPKNSLDINLFFSSLSFIVIAALAEEIFKYLVIVKKIGDFFIARSIILWFFFGRFEFFGCRDGAYLCPGRGTVDCVFPLYYRDWHTPYVDGRNYRLYCRRQQSQKDYDFCEGSALNDKCPFYI
jgi:hypothetical protein